MKLKLHWQIAIALALAAIIGGMTGTETGLFGVTLYQVYDFIGTLFMNALKMLIVPLVVSSIIVGIAGIGSGDALGRLGGKTLLYYMTTSLIAVLIGLLVVNLVTPGYVDGKPASDLVARHLNPLLFSLPGVHPHKQD